VTEWREIQQFEYRWQPSKDLSLIAGSLLPADIQPWSDRIALWVRHRADDVPAESVRYEMFGDGIAALAWRRRTSKRAESMGEAEGRPETSRVLLGPVRWLTPEVAVAVCRTGLPDAVGPRPGEVAVSGDLPPIDPDELTGLARGATAGLDRLAMEEHGLDRVIAAALASRDVALSVQLPGRIIAKPPQQGSQGPLLWGLRRVLWPLLGDDSGGRGWSFSTFEPPLGEVTTEALADIVFRIHHAVQPAMSMRQEIVVRPHEPKERPISIRCRDFARLLVDAYRHMGGDKLAWHLDTVGGEYESVDERIERVRETLHRVLPVTAVSAPRPRQAPAGGPPPAEPAPAPPASGLAPTGNAEPAGGTGWAGDVTPHERVTVADAAAPAAAAQADPAPYFPDAAALHPGPAAPYPEPAALPPAPPPSAAPAVPVRPAAWGARTSASRLAATSRAAEQDPPLAAAGPPPARAGAGPERPGPEPPRPEVSRLEPPSPEPHRPEVSESSPPYDLTTLLNELHADPAGAESGPALQLLLTGNVAHSRTGRALARQMMADRGWYIPVLAQHDRGQVGETLEAIFRLAVIPDLNSPEVMAEIAGWTDEGAPPPVIKALMAAAQSRSGAPGLMLKALAGPLARRWLAEHEIDPGPTAPAAAAAPRPRSVHAADGQRPLLAWLGDGLRGDPIPLLAIFLVLILLLVLLIRH
jgi:hypothetical protein